jgi:hypothetical protein
MFLIGHDSSIEHPMRIVYLDQGRSDTRPTLIVVTFIDAVLTGRFTGRSGTLGR